MTYVFVHYLSFLIAAGALGFLIGWWATGSSRGRAGTGESGEGGAT